MIKTLANINLSGRGAIFYFKNNKRKKFYQLFEQKYFLHLFFFISKNNDHLIKKKKFYRHLHAFNFGTHIYYQQSNYKSSRQFFFFFFFFLSTLSYKVRCKIWSTKGIAKTNNASLTCIKSIFFIFFWCRVIKHLTFNQSLIFRFTIVYSRQISLFYFIIHFTYVQKLVS